jgi:hypothetical protein
MGSREKPSNISMDSDRETRYHQCLLFIIVTDVLNSLFVKASEAELLQPLSNRMAAQQLSLDADDVALFIKPVDEEVQATMVILDAFRLQTNLRACLVSLFSDARSKQAAATKIRILGASPILRVLVDANEATSLHRGENAKCLARFSRFSSPQRR